MALLQFSDNNFKEEVLNSELPVLVDFWAPWCGPCRMMTPIIEELTSEFCGKVKVGKLNVDENPQIPSQYGIMSIPTIILFKNGQVIEQVRGALNKSQLRKKITETLS